MKMDRESLLQLNLLFIFFHALSPDIFRHVCTSQLIISDELYSRPVQQLLMVERSAEA